MKFLLCLVLLSKLSRSSQNFLMQNDSLKSSFLLQSAMQRVTEKFSETNRDVLVINVDGSAYDDDSLILKDSSLEISPYIVRNGRFVRALEDSAILKFKNVHSLQSFNKEIKLMNRFPKPLQFLVHCEKSTVTDIQQLDDDSPILDFEYFLIEENDSVRLMTFVRYTENKCNELQLVEINKFDGKTKTWKSSEFFIEKYRNFHGCQVTFDTFNQPPALMVDQFGASGYLADALLAISGHLNFKADLNPVHENRKSFNSDCKIFQASYHYALSVSITQPSFFQDHYIAVSPERKYTDYEKFFLPFDIETWELIFSVFGIAFGTIFLLRFVKPQIRNFIIGSNVTTPSLNVAAIFFGIHRLNLPRRNFARYLAMIFILYSLIIRRAWQGKNFELLQKDIELPGAQSIDELIKLNYTLVVTDDGYELAGE